MKLWLVVILLTIGVNQVCHKQQEQPYAHVGDRNRSVQAGGLFSTSFWPLVFQTHTAKQEERTEDAPKPWYGWLWIIIRKWQYSIFDPTWDLFYAAAVGIYVANRTLETIARQTEETARSATAAKISAEAAKTSSAALINIERAWLIPSDTVKLKSLPKIRLQGAQIERLIVQIENFGHTPAWLTDWSFTVEAIDGAKTEIGALINADAPEGDNPYARPFPPGKKEDFPIEWKITDPSEIDDVRDGKRQLYVYGFIEYQDTVGKNRCLSRFCFHYHSARDSNGHIDEMWMIDPPEWNNYT